MNEYGRPAGRRRDGVPHRIPVGFRRREGPEAKSGYAPGCRCNTAEVCWAGPVPFPRFPRNCPDAAFRGRCRGVAPGEADSGIREGCVSGTEAGRFRPRRPVRTAVRRTFRGPLPPHGPLPPGCGAPCGRKVPLPRPYCRTGPFLPPAAGCPAAYGAGVFPIGPFAIRRKDRAIRVKSGRTTAEIRLRTCSFLGFVLILPEEISGR